MLAAQSSNLSGLLIWPLIFLAMYFLILRPNQKRSAAQRDLARSIGEGDEVVTTSGLYGFVTAIEGDVVWLEIADGVDVRIATGSIARKVPPSATATHDDADHGSSDAEPADASPGSPTETDADAPASDGTSSDPASN